MTSSFCVAILHKLIPRDLVQHFSQNVAKFKTVCME